jgi:hypothetical protein
LVLRYSKILESVQWMKSNPSTCPTDHLNAPLHQTFYQIMGQPRVRSYREQDGSLTTHVLRDDTTGTIFCDLFHEATPVVRLSSDLCQSILAPNNPYLHEDHAKLVFDCFHIEFEDPPEIYPDIEEHRSRVHGVSIVKLRQGDPVLRPFISSLGSSRAVQLGQLEQSSAIMSFMHIDYGIFTADLPNTGPTSTRSIETHSLVLQMFQNNAPIVIPDDELTDLPIPKFWGHGRILGRNILDLLSSPSIRLASVNLTQKRRGKKKKRSTRKVFEIDWSTTTKEAGAGGSGSRHSYRYDVRGNWATFTKGRLAGRRIWRKPHQRGLDADGLRQRTYKR